MSWCSFRKTDDVAQNGMSAISYYQWKVNKFRLPSDGIIGNQIVPIDLQNAKLCLHVKCLHSPHPGKTTHWPHPSLIQLWITAV